MYGVLWLSRLDRRHVQWHKCTIFAQKPHKNRVDLWKCGSLKRPFPPHLKVRKNNVNSTRTLRRLDTKVFCKPLTNYFATAPLDFMFKCRTKVFSDQSRSTNRVPGRDCQITASRHWVLPQRSLGLQHSFRWEDRWCEKERVQRQMNRSEI